jgi:Rieske Fe-S protein
MKRIPLFLAIFSLLAIFSCKKDGKANPNPIPYVTVYQSFSMALPPYNNLLLEGHYVYIDNAGVRGLLVVHDYLDQYIAFDRVCPYHPGASCAQVSMDKNGLTIYCGTFDTQGKLTSCCDSQYDIDGNVKHGPSTYPLKRYNVSVNGNLLTITN